MNGNAAKKKVGRRYGGQAIVPVIFIMMILTVLAVAFATSARREVRAASNFVNQTQEFYAAHGAVNEAMSALAQTSSNGATYGVVQRSAETDANGWEQVGDVWVKVDVTDTGGLLNINNATLTTLQMIPILQQNPDVAAALIDWKTAGETPSANGAKSDYYQSLPTPYQCKDAPFDSIDEMLLVKGVTPTLLYGMTVAGAALPASAMAGGQSSSAAPGLSRQAASGGTGSAGSGSGSGATATGAALAQQVFANSTLSLASMLTTLTQERNVAVDGTPRVNINTASAQDLQQKAGMSANLARRLVSYRGTSSTTGGGATGGGQGSGGAAGGGTGGGGGAPGLGGMTGGRPGLQGGGGPGLQGATTGVLGRPGTRAGDLTRQAAGGAKPGLGATAGAASGATGGASGGALSNSGGGANNQAFKSLGDLLNVPGFTSSVMASVADHLTTNSNPYNQNVVNINTAPQEVLATVTGMDTTILNAILSNRQNGQAFQSLDDLFALNTLSRAEMQAVIGSLCTKSSVYVVHVKVRALGQQSVYAVSALVRMTDYGPQLLQWREEPRTPGWAYWTTPPTLPLPTPATSTTTGGSG